MGKTNERLFHFNESKKLLAGDPEADEHIWPVRHPNDRGEAAKLSHQHRCQETSRSLGHGEADGRAKSSHQILVQIRGRKFCRSKNVDLLLGSSLPTYLSVT